MSEEYDILSSFIDHASEIHSGGSEAKWALNSLVDELAVLREALEKIVDPRTDPAFFESCAQSALDKT